MDSVWDNSNYHCNTLVTPYQVHAVQTNEVKKRQLPILGFSDVMYVLRSIFHPEPEMTLEHFQIAQIWQNMKMGKMQ